MNSRWVDQCLAPLISSACFCCGRRTDSGSLCPACEDDLPWNLSACPSCAQPLSSARLCVKCLKRAPSFDSAWTAFVLNGPVQRGIHRFKYAAQFHEARWLSELMAARLNNRLRQTPPELRPDLVIPVPTSRKKLFLRGFDHVNELAKLLCPNLQIASQTGLVSLTREPQEQIGQNALTRRKNLRGVFAARANLNGKRIAILDDVMTTGATFEALAETLKKAGADHVEAWALARTP